MDSKITPDKQSMDKEISPAELRKARNRKLLIYGGSAAAAVALVMGFMELTRDSLDLAKLNVVDVTTGEVDASVRGSGTIVPAFEEVITSPLTTSIREVYHNVGDEVEAGTPLVRLDLAGALVDYESRLDGIRMKQLELKQLKANNITSLADLELKIKVSEMKLDRQRVELRNERYLDSIGSSTTDRVRELDLAYKSGMLELEQQRRHLANQREVLSAGERIKELELEIQSKELAKAKAQLDDAEIRSPRHATVTSVVTELGSQISAGQMVATIADLGHYKVNGTIAESYSQAFTVGSPATVQLNRGAKLAGRVINVSPKASNGAITFTVALDNDTAAVLRPGTHADINISQGIMPDVTRIPNQQFYTQPGNYTLYVLNADGTEAERRNIKLGTASFDFIEVISGLRPGEKVITNDLTKSIGNKELIKIRNNK